MRLVSHNLLEKTLSDSQLIWSFHSLIRRKFVCGASLFQLNVFNISAILEDCLTGFSLHLCR